MSKIRTIEGAIRETTKREGKKVSMSIAQVRECVGHFIDVIVEADRDEQEKAGGCVQWMQMFDDRYEKRHGKRKKKTVRKPRTKQNGAEFVGKTLSRRGSNKKKVRKKK